jgi:hypothetical protein
MRETRSHEAWVGETLSALKPLVAAYRHFEYQIRPGSDHNKILTSSTPTNCTVV